MKRPLLFLITLSFVAAVMLNSIPVRAWGEHGHLLAGRAAAMKLPDQTPGFLRKAVNQLSYLNPEPDRWRSNDEANVDKALSQGLAPDHYIDLEFVPQGALLLPNRNDFAAELVKAGRKPAEAGFLPFRTLELFQRLRIGFRLWRATTDKTKRQWIEQRLINDAGILGHYVSDGANPHHTTMHHNGWVGDNPKGFTVPSRERGFHGRFEDEYVRTHVQLNDVLPLITGQPRVIDRPRDEILAYLQTSHSKVEALFVLDKQEQFGELTRSEDHKRFACERLAAGATMLRDLWWTAWVTSGAPVAPPVTTSR